MNLNTNYSVLILCTVLALSCKNEGGQTSYTKVHESRHSNDSPQTEYVDAAHNSKSSLDWAGSYYGTLPCIDCDGVETRLSFSLSGKFTLIENHIGKSSGNKMSGGVMGWNEQGSIVRLMGLKVDSDYHQYLVQENQLVKLAGTGERFVGQDADKYVLVKTKKDPSLKAVNWKLKELKTYKGESIDKRPPTLRIDQSTGQFSAYSSCNNVNGTVHILEGDKISFGQMAVTRMACPDMNLEQLFLNALENVSNYRLVDGQLILGMPDYPDLMLFETLE